MVPPWEKLPNDLSGVENIGRESAQHTEGPFGMMSLVDNGKDLAHAPGA